jgi:hypothetical protein
VTSYVATFPFPVTYYVAPSIPCDLLYDNLFISCDLLCGHLSISCDLLCGTFHFLCPVIWHTFHFLWPILWPPFYFSDLLCNHLSISCDILNDHLFVSLYLLCGHLSIFSHTVYSITTKQNCSPLQFQSFLNCIVAKKGTPKPLLKLFLSSFVPVWQKVYCGPLN